MLEFEKIRKYLLSAGLLLALSANTFSIGQDVQLYFLIFIIALTGVPHGSLDFFIEKQSLINNHKTFLSKHFLLNTFSACCAMVFYGGYSQLYH